MTDGEHTVEAGGIAHWVRIAGAAHGTVPLILVHGGPGGSAYPYEAIGDRLAENTTVVFYDQRGCGRSAHPADPSTFTVKQLVADLEQLRATLGANQIVPWGVSYGALVAAEYTVTHHAQVQRLILQAPPIVGPMHPGPWTTRAAAADTIVGPATRTALRATLTGLDDPVQRAWAIFRILSDDPEAQTRFHYHDPANAPVANADTPTYGFNEDMARALIGNERPDLVDALAEIDIPTLVMIGLWDRNTGVDASRDLAQRLPKSTLRLFTRSAHLPHDEEPDAYIAAIHSFLER